MGLIAELLSSGEMTELDSLIHKSYADPLGDREQLIDDLHDMYRFFDTIKVTFNDIKQLSKSPKTNSQKISAQLETQLLGEYTWSFRGPIQLEFVHQPSAQIQSGLLSNVRDIIKLMNARVAAIESNSATAYTNILHPNYRRGDENKKEAQSRLKKTLNGKLRLRPDRYLVDLDVNQAHLTEWALVSRSQVEPTVSSSISESNRNSTDGVGIMTKSEFTLRKSAGQWLIHSIHGQF